VVIELIYNADLCTGCDACQVIFPGLIDLADEDGRIFIDAIGVVFLQVGRAAFSCKSGALRVGAP